MSTTNNSFIPSMLFTATVTKWTTKKPDCKKRVRDTTNGTTYLLNTNRLSGIRAMTDTTYSSLYYFDNPFDKRESAGYMEVKMTVAQLKTQMDTAPTHGMVTLPIYPKMDSTKSTVNTTVPVANIAFAVAVADSGSASDTIVYYVNSAYKLVRARVNLTTTALLALIA
jgi:hypothetical protein